MTTKQKYLERYEKWLILSNYSSATRKLYLNSVGTFWRWCEKQLPGFDKTIAPFLYLSERKKTKAWTTVNAEYSGIKHFYVSILEREWAAHKLPRPRKENHLPVILSQQEVEQMVMHGGSFRNSVLMTLIYATGLRLGEVARLRLVDINSNNMTLHVHNGKGAKDRILPLPTDLLPLLRDYFRQYKPEVYLFNGDTKGEPMAHRTIQSIVASSRVAAGIKRPASVHTLRHCFATHFYQNGSNGIALQFLLGHKNFKTTTRYVHLSGEHFRLLYNPAATICQQLSPPPPPPLPPPSANIPGKTPGKTPKKTPKKAPKKTRSNIPSPPSSGNSCPD